MASAEDDFAGGSLFEGMVLFSPSDDSSPPPPPSALTPPPPSTSPPPPPSPPADPQSRPLDEDLFSDLTLQPPSQSQTLEPDPSPSPSPSPTNSHHPPSRQISRKKKRAVRIGYGRDSIPLEDSSPLPIPVPIKPQDAQLPKEEILPAVLRDQVDETTRIEEPQLAKGEILPAVIEDQVTETAAMVEEELKKEEAVDSVEDKLELVRARISSKLDKIRGTAALVSVQRKELGRRRRKAMENVILASDNYKELERQLEEACEAEDFERAERVSESLAEKEKEKDQLSGELRDAELECDAVDSKMQEVLESQIAAEEEGAALLEQFAKVWGCEH